MTLGHSKPEENHTGHPNLVLEVAGQKKPTPLLIPVIIQNLSMGGVTLAVASPWGIADWDRFRGENCILRVVAPDDQELAHIKAKIAWTKVGGKCQPPMSLGLQMIKPSAEALRRLSSLLSHTCQDMQGLWDRYDQIREIPGPSQLLHHCYVAGLVLLVGGLVLQFAGSPTYKMCGWALWLVGSLGVAGKILWPLWQNRISGDRIGKTL
jgi:hypothetical protein